MGDKSSFLHKVMHWLYQYMKNKKSEDHQLWSLFVILAVLTVLAVYITKVVLFAPPLFIESAIK